MQVGVHFDADEAIAAPGATAFNLQENNPIAAPAVGHKRLCYTTVL